ncbi:hypothetical protein [Dactylosporangium sp. NPDC051484]|uniref:hypothetical protein n=1 Tax=Dactylosporangium sp. NPDC051484 TaxID=3154942 RepID=UPI00345067AB
MAGEVVELERTGFNAARDAVLADQTGQADRQHFGGKRRAGLLVDLEGRILLPVWAAAVGFRPHVIAAPADREVSRTSRGPGRTQRDRAR